MVYGIESLAKKTMATCSCRKRQRGSSEKQSQSEDAGEVTAGEKKKENGEGEIFIIDKGAAEIFARMIRAK